MTLDGDLDVTVAGDDRERTVTFAFTVTNTRGEPIELQFANACKADFAVKADGEEIWRFSEGRMFAQMLCQDRLEPGERVVYDAEWGDCEPGTYTAIAELRAREATCNARSHVTVPAESS